MTQILLLLIMSHSISSASESKLGPIKSTQTIIAKEMSTTWTKWPFFQQIPFWRGNESIEKKAVNERSIIVSVRSVKKNGEESSTLTLKGYGHIKVPIEQSYVYAKDLGKLQDVSEYIITTQWRPQTGDLYMHSKAYKYHARMWMSVHFEETALNKTIWFKIDRGVFQGMAGKLNFISGPSDTAFIEFLAQYEYQKLGIPQFFIQFGLEVVLEKLANRLRHHYESKYKKAI